MSRLLILGIDSLDPLLLIKYSKDLPNLTKLSKNSPDIHLSSVFPVDSIPAWASIYTGWNPARHGIIRTFDVFDSNLKDVLNIDTTIFQGKTFWDYLSKSGKKICVLFPLLAYPSWKINGIMISRSIQEQKVIGESEWVVEKEIKTYPSWISKKYNIPEFMRGVTGKHPGKKNLIKWSDDAKKAILNEIDLGLNICKNEEWDIFFIYFSWLDIIQHRLWRYSDENDPSYPGSNPYKNIIKDFYKIIDMSVGNFLNLCSDATTIVFSDHGHGMRPIKVVNINKVLREEGLLFSNNNKFNNFNYITETIKISVLDFVRMFELDNELVNLSTRTRSLSSISKRVYMSTSNLKKEKIIVHLSAFAGVKSYPHGGIEIEKNNLNMDYEDLRNKIIDILLKIKEPQSDEKLIRWACRREDLYGQFENSDQYPDIVFYLKDEYGVGWNMYGGLIGKAYDHILASGGHKSDAVFLISNLETKKIIRDNMTLMDLTPTILDIMNIKGENIFDGKSIFKK